MPRKKWTPSALFKQVLFFLLGALLTGFLTVAFAKLLGRHIGPKVAVPLGVGLATALTLSFSQFMKHPPFLLKGTSPLIAGFCAAMGVHVSQVWLS